MKEPDFCAAAKAITDEYERKYFRDRLVFGVLAILMLGVLAFLLVACQMPLR